MQTFGLRKTYGNCKLHIRLTYIFMANVLLSNSYITHILYNYDNRLTIISRDVNCFNVKFKTVQIRLQTHVTRSSRYWIGLPYYCNLINRFNCDSAADLAHCSLITSLYWFVFHSLTRFTRARYTKTNVKHKHVIVFTHNTYYIIIYRYRYA